MNEYSQFMRQQSFSVQAEEDGTCVLKNWNGAELHCDPRGRVSSDRAGLERLFPRCRCPWKTGRLA